MGGPWRIGRQRLGSSPYLNGAGSIYTEVQGMERMTFGKHKGLPCCDVPIEYLLWAADTLGAPPQCVIDELKRRAERHGTRESVAAASAVCSLAFKPAEKNRRKHRRKMIKRERKRAKRATCLG